MRLPLCMEFTYADSVKAYESWGANCGPNAIAAMCGMTLDQVRPHLGDFESKRYTNPTLMWEALHSIGAGHYLNRPPQFPRYGLARIQWHGPWMNEGVPIAARYRQTHWVGSCKMTNGRTGIYDVNCMNNGLGWVSLEDWEQVIVPAIVSNTPRADGKWSVTHGVEIIELIRDGKRVSTRHQAQQ